MKWLAGDDHYIKTECGQYTICRSPWDGPEGDKVYLLFGLRRLGEDALTYGSGADQWTWGKALVLWRAFSAAECIEAARDHLAQRTKTWMKGAGQWEQERVKRLSATSSR